MTRLRSVVMGAFPPPGGTPVGCNPIVLFDRCTPEAIKNLRRGKRRAIAVRALPFLGIFALLVACGAEAPREAARALPAIEWPDGRANPLPPAIPATEPTPTPRTSTDQPLPPTPVEPPEPAEPPQAPSAQDAWLRLNQLQARGTHNSYHLRPLNNDRITWQYDMPSIHEQLATHALRAFEFDVHAINGTLQVYHMFEDPRSTCTPLSVCLSQVAAWMQAHTNHAPLLIFIEQKNYWTAADVDRVELTVRSAFPPDRLFVPDELTGNSYAHVLEAVQAHGWPTLGAMRGKVVVALAANQAMTYSYTREGSSLRGRAMFVAASAAGDPNVAVLKQDYPIEQETQIRQAVAAGLLVRTRADGYPGIVKDPAAMHRAALQSGAQFVLTDYPAGSAYFPGYSSLFPEGGNLRCNPVAAADGCRWEDLE